LLQVVLLFQAYEGIVRELERRSKTIFVKTNPHKIYKHLNIYKISNPFRKFFQNRFAIPRRPLLILHLPHVSFTCDSRGQVSPQPRLRTNLLGVVSNNRKSPQTVDHGTKVLGRRALAVLERTTRWPGGVLS
jgi:hypothetical protein